MRPRTLLALLPLLVASPAAAQNATTAGALELWPNFHAIGVRLAFTGDLNANATARIEWKRSADAVWNVGVSMTRISGSRWAGSLLWLSPGTAYDVRVAVDDPDGGALATSSATTRSDPPATPAGRTWWVATNGNDANTGDSGSPLATLQAAAARAQAGDEIRVRPGTYHQWLDTPRSGTASAYIHLVADGAGTILDGSDPAYLNRSDWQNDGGGVWSVPFAGVTRLVCADDEQRLYHHASVADLQAGTGGIAQGWTISAGRLYVRLEDGSSPAGHVMHVARYNVGVYVDNSYWQVRGFEVRFFGTGANAAGIQLLAGSNRVLTNNTVHTIGGRNIFARIGCSNDLIERNTSLDHRIHTWPWDMTKAHEEEQQGISWRGGRGAVIRYNTVRGTFDGIDVAGNDVGDENEGADADVHENTISRTRDDALEPETIGGINTRVWRNAVNDVFSGISIAPNQQGPLYVLYNTFTNYWMRGYKCSLSSVGQTFVYHNTFASSTSPTAGIHPTGPYSNMHFRNNVLYGNGSACVSDDAGESQTGNTFDGDLVHSNYAALFRWKGTNYSTLSALRSGTGFEASGRSGNPLFAALATGDVSLLLGSPAIDGAIRIPGINDTWKGLGPDIGAREFDSGPDVVAPAAITDLR